MDYFENCHTLDELKKEYRRLSMLHHPDMGGNTTTMQAINSAHDTRFEILKAGHNAAADADHQTTETAEEFRDILNILLRLRGLDVELCGSWLWIGGNTKEHKDALKAAGCRWSQNKVKWYWHHYEQGHRWHKGSASMQDIRSKYGSQTFCAGQETSNYAAVSA